MIVDCHGVTVRGIAALLAAHKSPTALAVWKPSVVHCPHHRSGVRHMPIGYPEHIQVPPLSEWKSFSAL